MFLVKSLNRCHVVLNDEFKPLILWGSRYFDVETFSDVESGERLHTYLKREYLDNKNEILEKVEKIKAKYNAPTTTPQPTSDLGSKLENMLLQVLAAQSVDKVMDMAKPLLDEHIKTTYGVLPKVVKVETPTKTTEIPGVTHEKFESVLNLVNLDIPVFLTGQAGTGKNVICKQVAQALDLEFYFTNAVTQEYKLTGFIDANGVYQETQFYKAFKNGGLFFLDEMDASIPEVLIILNAAIANRYFDFSNGKINAHPDFRVIAAGNTFGTGADAEYSGRFQLDAASLDRFAMIEIAYSREIENALSGGNSELVEFAHDFRNAVSECGMRHLFTYRSIERISKLQESPVFDLSEVLRISLFKGMGTDDIKILLNAIKNKNNKYYNASLKLK